MNDYDITAAFEAIENELIASMMRNMSRHRAEETKEGYEWSMWQAEQLKALEKYRRENQKRYKKQFKSINKQIAVLIQQARQEGNMEQEIKILQAIKKGWKVHGKNGSPRPKAMTAEFFRLNDRKLAALIEATVHDMQEAEKAILRKAEDDYRKAIFNAQVYANTGAGTYEKAVDMATRDMLSRGLGCVEYANGSRHTLVDYASMAIRTASKRAYLYGEGEKRQEWGITTVIMAKRGNPCPKCLPFVGKVLVDDVWSGGRSDGYDPETGKRYPTISHAIECGLYHPNCKDSHTTYFPGISTADDKWTAKELRAIGVKYEAEQRQQYAKRQAEKFGRLAEHSLDEENQKRYGIKAREWKRARFKTGDKNSREYVDTKKPLANFRAIPQNQVVNRLRKEYSAWKQSLDDFELKAVKKYTYNSNESGRDKFYMRLNAMLRGDIPRDDRILRYANGISSAIKKGVIPCDVICYRNMDTNPYSNLAVGDIFVEEQFVSTSVVESRALQKKCKLVIYVPKGSKAAYIESVSKFPTQREVLIDKGSIYRVISKKEDIIELEVIP